MANSETGCPGSAPAAPTLRASSGRSHAPAGAGEPAYPSPAYAGYVLGVLMLVYTLAYIDRQILAYMVEPVKRDLGLGDTDLSLLLGFAFVVLYTVAGLPLARMADSGSRRNIIAGGVVIWSLSTTLCGFARNFSQMFLARMGLGLGEACLNPAAIPLLADYFPRHRLGRAMGLYMVAIPLGSGLASILGGALLGRLSAGGAVAVPLLGPVAPWRLMLGVIGLSGLLIAALLLTVREPPRRGGVRRDARNRIASLPLREIAAYLGRHRLVLAGLVAPLVVSALMTFGVGYWIPSFFLRSFGLDASQAAHYLYYWGVVTMVFGGLGVLGGGYLSDLLAARWRGGRWGTLAVGALLLGPGYTLFAIMPSPALALLMLVPATLGGGILQASGLVTLMSLVPNQMRGQVAALMFFLVNLVGAGLGPTVIALLTDGVFGAPEGLQYSLFSVALVTSLPALWLLWRAFRPYLAMLDGAPDQA